LLHPTVAPSEQQKDPNNNKKRRGQRSRLLSLPPKEGPVQRMLLPAPTDPKEGRRISSLQLILNNIPATI